MVWLFIKECIKLIITGRDNWNLERDSEATEYDWLIEIWKSNWILYQFWSIEDGNGSSSS